MDAAESGKINKSDKVPLLGKTAYSFTGLAYQLTATMVGAYVVYFFTNVAHMNLGAVGTLMLLARICSALGAPLAGIFIDNTHTKWGKARPWYLWMTIPVSLVTVLLFVVPNFSSAAANMAYIWAFYIIWSLLEIFIDTPTTAILPMLTSNKDERTLLNSLRNGGSQIGGLIANAAVLPLVAILGGNNDKKGFLLTAMLMAAMSVVCYVFVFSGLREKNNTQVTEAATEKKPKLSMSESFGAIKGNWPWVLVFIITILNFIANMSRNTGVIYYFQYGLHNRTMTALANGLNTTQLITIALLPIFVKKIGQTNTWILGTVMSAFAQVMILFSGQNITMVLVWWVVSNLGMGFSVPLIFAVIAETVDYGEWKSGINAPGLLSGIGATTANKFGGGLGAALVPWVLAGFGYNATAATQSAHALTGINIAFIWIPAVIYMLSVIPMIFYKKYEKMGPTIKKELKERRAAK